LKEFEIKMATVNETLLTAEEFLKLGPDELPEYCELVQGKVVEINVPAPRHGQVCAEFAFQLKLYCRQTNWGHIVTNDSGVVTKRNPDTVRGADIACYSYERLPQGPLPSGYLDAVPELIGEVLSPSDRWPQTLVKVAEYLEAGVGVVCVIDPEQQSIHVFRIDGLNAVLHDTDTLTLPTILPGFELPLQELFG
jgi:Uma2 family endonuclease